MHLNVLDRRSYRRVLKPPPPIFLGLGSDTYPLVPPSDGDEGSWKLSKSTEMAWWGDGGK